MRVSFIVRLLLAGLTGAEAVNHVGLYEGSDCLGEDVPFGFGNLTFLQHVFEWVSAVEGTDHLN